MGMDGLSIANTGVIQEQTSAERAARTEQAVNSESANAAQQVQSTNANPRVKEKEEGEQQQRQQNPQNPAQEEVFEDGLVENKEPEIPEEYDFEDFDNPNKDFYVKLNVKDDIIELYDSTSDRLIETISGSELGELVQKLNMASGIFVNKKV
ncbi:hypothetical protein IKQ21_09765 [bacterium]|nr:hypothetical protein [bacterium]